MIVYNLEELEDMEKDGFLPLSMIKLWKKMIGGCSICFLDYN